MFVPDHPSPKSQRNSNPDMTLENNNVPLNILGSQNRNSKKAFMKNTELEDISEEKYDKLVS